MDNLGPSPWSLIGAQGRAKVLLLGTFHFHNPGLDAFKSAHVIDVLSPSRQAEISELVTPLSRFAHQGGG